MIKGAKAEEVIKTLHPPPLKHRKKVKEKTLDMADNICLLLEDHYQTQLL
jgi:hypothetical protein